MSLKFAGSVLQGQLDAITGALLGGYIVHLFQNSANPSETSVLSDFTESTFPGYSAQAGVGFPASSLVGSVAESVDSQIVFTASTGTFSENVYGYYVTNNTGGYLYGELNPAGAVTMNTPGQIYAVTPRLTQANQ